MVHRLSSFSLFLRIQRSITDLITSNTYFDPSDPGPSNTQRSPSVVLASPKRQRQNQSSTPQASRQAPQATREMMSSQVTLVPTQVPPVVRDQTRMTANLQVNPLRDVNGAQNQRQSLTAAASPTRGGAAKRTATVFVRSPAVVRDADQAPPYRNTRARSRSADPSVANVAKRTAQRRGKKAALVPDRNPELVIAEEEETNVHVSQSQGGGIGTFAEEAVVGDMLLNDDDAAVEPEPDDDAQIRRALERPDEAGTGESDSDSDLDFEAEMEAKLHAVDAHNDELQPQPGGAHGSKPPRSVPLKQVDFVSRQVQIPVPTSTVTPPRRDLRNRLRSGVVAAATLANVFPSPGTKAREVKEQRDREAKSTPYIAAEGTRASAYRAKVR